MRSEVFFDTHPVFTFDEYRASRANPNGSSSTVKNLLTGHVASGRLVRVRQGLYASVPRSIKAAEFEPDPYLIASSAAPGAVVCGHAALQFFGKAYSVWSRFHFFTSLRRRGFTFRGSTFVPLLDPAPLHSSSAREAGVLTRAHAGGTVRVCSLERTLVDVMSAPERAGGWEEVWRSLEMVEFFDLAAVTDYARSMESALTAARVGLFLDLHAESLLVEPADLDVLREMAPLQPRYLDAAHSPGQLDARWNVIVPHWLEARTWEETA
ncbi:MAG: transcriptional regulator [Coriobacteriia bacterium]|nr:transcriptional regulator [Coriobacteriia bacterium]